MKIIKKIAAVLVLVTMIFTASGCDLIREIINLYNVPSYSQRKYIAPDKDATDKLFEEIKTLCATSGNDNAIITKRNAFMLKYSQAMTSRTVANLEYYNDVTDGQAKTRSEEIDVYFNQLHNQALEMEKTILTSSYKDLLIDSLGQDYADQILGQTVKTDEMLDAEARITELENSYSSLMAKADAQDVASEAAQIYKNLIVERNKLAKLNKKRDGTPYSNYHEYAYAEIYGRDYTPEQANTFRQAIKDNFYAIGKKLNDTSSSFITSNALTLGLNESGIKQIMPTIINNTAESMLSSWDYMISMGLYNFAVSEKKFNNSFVVEFQQYDDGFMFIDATGGLINDLSTIIHEFGHYNAIFGADEEKEGNSGIYSIDLAETHSQAFELLTLPAVKKVLESNGYGSVYTAYADNLLLQSVWSMLSNSMFDEFEYTVYTADESLLNREFFENTFYSVWNNYWPMKNGKTNYEYYDISHLFTSPSYCISYSVSMVFASEIWMSGTPVSDYLKVVSYGTGYNVKQVASAVNLPDPLSADNISKVAAHYKSQIQSMLGLSFGGGTFDA